MILAYFQHNFQRTFSIKLFVHAPGVFLACCCSRFWLWKKSKPKFNRKPKDGIVLTGKPYYESTNAKPCLLQTWSSSFRDEPPSSPESPSSPKPRKMGKERKAHHPSKAPDKLGDHSFLLHVGVNLGQSLLNGQPMRQEAKQRGGSTSFRKCSWTFLPIRHSLSLDFSELWGSVFTC